MLKIFYTKSMKIMKFITKMKMKKTLTKMKISLRSIKTKWILILKNSILQKETMMMIMCNKMGKKMLKTVNFILRSYKNSKWWINRKMKQKIMRVYLDKINLRVVLQMIMDSTNFRQINLIISAHQPPPPPWQKQSNNKVWKQQYSITTKQSINSSSWSMRK